MLRETRRRIAFAAEGVGLAAADALDFVRGHIGGVAVALVASAAVVALALGIGGADEPTNTSDASAGPTGISPSDAAYVSERGFSLSLPVGWKRTGSPGGSAFAAASADGLAETTLWVERDGRLSFDSFVEQSMQNLDEIATDVHVSDRVDGPMLESKMAELRAEVPLDGDLTAPYRVTLRAAGPYRYYLATSVQPGAPAQLLADSEILGSSFRPAVRLEGVDGPVTE